MGMDQSKQGMNVMLDLDTIVRRSGYVYDVLREYAAECLKQDAFGSLVDSR